MPKRKPKMRPAAQPAKSSRLVDHFVMQLAQLWIVAQCRCTPMRIWHSTSHLDCFSVEPWLVEEFRTCAKTIVDQQPAEVETPRERPPIPTVLVNSLDSLQIEVDSLCSTARRH
ncbi:hypothetical protein M3Y99_01959000 [Aphelenchoides fujianensis]|nr:hypothetical protein M3Y99_01965200 [Aphelenchoides fujianensis]KAI6185125.1 hypothetical protein M3Y99_01959000 [Aphelenchoides fujianensis]